ncbi:hypothetical protein A2V56_05040 [Candidatus Woesebacteria bacterium RBG_19FT_COMBO_42_9]|uniref:50S ribosomal protein L17 n=1 Tax=Candidatus Woesebacteria bacterium RBG_16_42_24 TaxID=1802485 RepID=A0A1F7XLT1_9BACT|nr:MAG: hypothetical protein A2V97_04270 [Candidatus Woesebacteria bacterium RBG_16_42_24]OGM17760.1 MAG: hypothetical protein A2V56_05040 [Candidatus Woesebacteria bacterium RBG_19FT_COMBO_42_9]OGM66849.1 MAG: hypothetical protein A2985_01720 [Candidatus Woesebacteria bacterium RIFCSPLOWO2_01_FULL_43_11]
MKKRVFGRKLSRGGGARKALFASLTRALVISGKIETTKAKAKAFVPEAERLVTLAKNGDSTRISAFFGNDRKITHDFTNLVRQFSRKSGFTRMVNLPNRVGDFAEMVRVEWVENIVKSEKDDSKKLTKKPKEGKPEKVAVKETKTKKVK